jgi:hypothetical protein
MLFRHELNIPVIHVIPLISVLLTLLLGVSDTCFANNIMSIRLDEEERPSFYGGRVVSHEGRDQNYKNSDTVEPLVHIHRRSVSPNTLKKKVPLPVVVPLKLEPSPPTLAVNKKSLTRADLLLAKKAKHYIERNWNTDTGLIDSVQGYHHATLWDIASGIAAILALENLQLISQQDANSRLDKTLSTIAIMPLYSDLLPNREYNTHTGLPSGTFSNSASNGNGWSALDIGRMLIWLQITKHYKPELATQIKRITQRWQLNRAIHNKTLFGELRTKKGTSYRQEGRLGYLQYAALGYQFAGFDVSAAFTQENTEMILQDNIPLYIDQRNLPFFTSDSYLLHAIEMGDPDAWWNQLQALYKLQLRQYNKTNQLWIFAEDAMSKPPWFSYNNINIYGKAWASTTISGKSIINPQIFSNKAAFAFSVLFDDDFSQKLAKTVITNSLSTQAIPTGLYQDGRINTAFNINTNSLILVSLWFKQRDNRPIYPSQHH